MPATRRELLRGNGYEFEAYPLLCGAQAARTRYEARGCECVLVPETYCTARYTVYFLGYRPKVRRQTRTDRGCFINA
jgi:hypothetical protein